MAACGGRGDPRYEPPKMLRNALRPPQVTCVRQRGRWDRGRCAGKGPGWKCAGFQAAAAKGRVQPGPPSPTEGCGGRGGAARTGGSALAPKPALGVEIPEELSAASPARCIGRPLRAVLGAGALAPAALASPRPLHKELGGWALGARLALGRGRRLLKAGRGRRASSCSVLQGKKRAVLGTEQTLLKQGRVSASGDYALEA